MHRAQTMGSYAPQHMLQTPKRSELVYWIEDSWAAWGALDDIT